ncbi:MAG: hypothetical protein WBA67_02405 [Jannaschia sp.]
MSGSDAASDAELRLITANERIRHLEDVLRLALALDQQDWLGRSDAWNLFHDVAERALTASKEVT